jgi:endoribonuclease LACTB2
MMTALLLKVVITKYFQLGTNTWLVGNGPSKILIDTGEFGTSEKYVAYLLGTVFPLTNTTSIATILLTHGHADHMGGVHTLLSELKKINQPTPNIFKRNVPNGKFPFQKFGCENILDGQCFDASRKRRVSGGCSGDNSEVVKEDEEEGEGDGDEEKEEEIILKALYTPGHTDDHVVFTLQVINCIPSYRL